MDRTGALVCYNNYWLSFIFNCSLVASYIGTRTSNQCTTKYHGAVISTANLSTVTTGRWQPDEDEVRQNHYNNWLIFNPLLYWVFCTWFYFLIAFGGWGKEIWIQGYGMVMCSYNCKDKELYTVSWEIS